MKIGQLFNGQEVVDVKRVNKLNLVQFMKQVDEYLSQGYKIDINSCRQVGLVLQGDVFKLSDVKVTTTEDKTIEVVVATPVEETSGTEQQVGEATDSTEPKPKTTRTKKA